MANTHDVNLLLRSVDDWNIWRTENQQARPDVSETDFGGRNLSNADLHGTHLRGCILRHADLSKANLEQADLSEVDLRGANLRAANLRMPLLLLQIFNKRRSLRLISPTPMYATLF